MSESRTTAEIFDAALLVAWNTYTAFYPGANTLEQFGAFQAGFIYGWRQT